MRKKRTKLFRRLFILAVASLVLAVFGFKVEASHDSGPVGDTAAQIDDEIGQTNNQDGGEVDAQLGSLWVSLDTTWVLIAGFLVFFMQCGFALLEAGLVRQTGVVNALLENFVDAGCTAIIFWAVGFGVAFGTDSGGIIGTDNFFLSEAFEIDEGSIVYKTIAEANPDIAYPNLTVLVFFFFQFAFAATASTITTGAMAERTDYVGDLIYTSLMAAFSYPIIVHWIWGGGWLFDKSFHDFAGGTVVHTVGGVTAIIGAWMLGPRANREWGKLPAAHNLGYATLGTMILWFGWYGFNPGSTLGAGNTGLIGLVTLNTSIGAGAGMVSCMVYHYFRSGKWDLGVTLNGSLAGLVAITPACAFVVPWVSILIGGIAGVLVLLAIDLVEKMKIDDPVGAFGVHGACGIFGTLSIGLFAQPELAFGEFAGKGGLLFGGGVDMLVVQAMGSAATVVFTGAFAFLMFGALKAIGRLRVNPIADTIGIDVYEHGTSVWPDVLPVPETPIPAHSGKAAQTAAAAGD
jgi:ammonium transporter, Amt family